MHLDNPMRSPTLYTAEKIEGGTYTNHHAMTEVRTETHHEIILFRSTQGYPNNGSTICLNHPRNGRIIKIIDIEKRKLAEGHAQYLGIQFGQTKTQGIECLTVCPQEHHAVFALRNHVPEYHRATILRTTDAINPTQVQGYPSAIANGEHPAIYRTPIILVSLYIVHYYTVGHTNVIGPSRCDLSVDVLPYKLLVELVSDIKEFLHK